MRSTRSRLEALEQGPGALVPFYRMEIGETEEQARARLGLSAASEVNFIQRVIVETPKATYAEH